MLGWVIGVGMSTAGVTGPAAGAQAVVRAADDDRDDDGRQRRSREDHRPAGRTLEMGPAATGLALLALGAAVVARRRRTARS